jgi:hypothetical protein
MIYGMDFSAFNRLNQTKDFTLKTTTMSRQNRNTERDRKSEEPKRDVAGSNERYSRQDRTSSRNEQDRNETNTISGLDRYRLNDLYERSSI